MDEIEDENVVEECVVYINRSEEGEMMNNSEEVGEGEVADVDERGGNERGRLYELCGQSI